jgi:hypothetical protein
MCRGVVYIETLPDVDLDDDGARLEYSSGGEDFFRRYPEPLWRAFLEREIGRLEDFDAARARKVVRLRKSDGAPGR